jgi:hypothetical protein
LETAAIWSRLGKSERAADCTGVDGSMCDAAEEEASFPIFLACDVCELKEENEASEAEGSLRGDRRTGGGVLCTTIVSVRAQDDSRYYAAMLEAKED